MGTRGLVETEHLNADDLRDLEIMRALKPYLARALTMNHDLNNPLCAILGYAEYILTDESLDPDVRKNIEQIQSAGERIRKLVESLCMEKIQATEKVDMSSLLPSHTAPKS